MKKATRLVGHKGRLLLGGRVSDLQRSSPYRRKWAQDKDGDLWEIFANIVEARGAHTVRLAKVKGHATVEMVESGQVDEEQKYGNDNADAAADNGATVSQKLTYAMARHYSFRHHFYRKLMVRIQK